MIQINAKAEAAAQDTVVVTGRGHNIKREAVHIKNRHLKSLKHFYIGQFELRIDESDLKWLKDEIEDHMLIRNEELTSHTFYETIRFRSKHNVVFAHLMDSTGDSYLAGLYLMKVNASDNQETHHSSSKKP